MQTDLTPLKHLLRVAKRFIADQRIIDWLLLGLVVSYVLLRTVSYIRQDWYYSLLFWFILSSGLASLNALFSRFYYASTGQNYARTAVLPGLLFYLPTLFFALFTHHAFTWLIGLVALPMFTFFERQKSITTGSSVLSLNHPLFYPYRGKSFVLIGLFIIIVLALLQNFRLSVFVPPILVLIFGLPAFFTKVTLFGIKSKHATSRLVVKKELKDILYWFFLFAASLIPSVWYPIPIPVLGFAVLMLLMLLIAVRCVAFGWWKNESGRNLVLSGFCISLVGSLLAPIAFALSVVLFSILIKRANSKLLLMYQSNRY